jgi:hypothetical protein
MRYFNLYRISSCLLLFFCATHTIGGMFSRPGRGAEADAVLSSMKSVKFAVQGANCTYYGFYFGFGIMVSIFLLFSAVLAWHLGGIDAEGRAALSPVAWAFFASHAATAVLSWVYFFIAPGVTATVIAVLLGLACIRKSW